MGSEESKEVSGETIQEQGDGCFWNIVLTGREAGDETEEGFDVGEGCCVFTRSPGTGTEAVYCRTGVEHLRLLRHPNILKYIWSDVSTSDITMVTEPVLPVAGMLTDTSVECLMLGWRGVADGLTFLHTKAGLSHNNLSMLSVFVSTVNSQWKVGGLELAYKHSKIDSKFISSLSSLRYKKAIPPEDKAQTPPTAPTPPHARDVWAFGHLILATLDKADLNDKVGDSLFLYVQDEMLNPDPCQRPTPSQVVSRSWMRSKGSEIFNFLSRFTLKSQSEKDQFFTTLPAQLFTLHPLFLAEHLVPLLVTPLVMAEPKARSTLWSHLLTPVSQTTPRPKAFTDGAVCPLLEEDMYIDHVLPLLLNLVESREVHVRTVLLEHLSCFVSVCSEEELMELILPEVLLGLKDRRVDVVQATLHALGDLVPLVGIEAVLGTSSEQLFTDSKPRSVPLSVGVATPLAPPTSTPSARGSREERQQRMKLKREQQKLKRQAQPKLGKLAGRQVEDLDEPDQTTPTTPPTTEDHTSQYSPSISHDEETPNDEVEEFEATSDKDDWDDKPDAESGSKEGEEDSEAWEDIVDDSGASGGGGWSDGGRGGGGGWGDSVRGGGGDSVKPQRTSSESSSRSSGMKLKLSKSVTSPSSQHTPSTPSQSTPSPVNSRTLSKSSLHKPPTRKSKSRSKHKASTNESSEFRAAMKGRLSEQDLARLEAKKMYAVKEPDFFANMEPTFAGSAQTSSTSSLPTGSTSQLSPSVGREDTSSEHSISSAMQYQPAEEEGTGWGEEEWNDF